MKISAKHIERWAETRDAEGELPRLIRGLAVPAGAVTLGVVKVDDSKNLITALVRANVS